MCGHDPQYDFEDTCVKDRLCRMKPRPINERATADQLWHRLEKLTRKYVYFGFTDESITTPSHGCTRPSTHKYMRAFITLDVVGVRPLFEMDSTLSQRCIALFFLATTVLLPFMVI